LLLRRVLFGLDPAPVAPTGGFAALWGLVGEHGLDAECFAETTGAGWTGRLDATFQIERGERHASKGHSANAVDELAPSYTGNLDHPAGQMTATSTSTRGLRVRKGLVRIHETSFVYSIEKSKSHPWAGRRGFVWRKKAWLNTEL
jgi:hypothetical protein